MMMYNEGRHLQSVANTICPFTAAIPRQAALAACRDEVDVSPARGSIAVSMAFGATHEAMWVLLASLVDLYPRVQCVTLCHTQLARTLKQRRTRHVM